MKKIKLNQYYFLIKKRHYLSVLHYQENLHAIINGNIHFCYAEYLPNLFKDT